MAATQTYQGLVMWQRQEIMGWMLNYIQGSYIADGFLPMTTTGNLAFKWGFNGAIGGMTPQSAENDAGSMIHVTYRQQTAMCQDYRERTALSLRVQDIDLIDVAKDNIQNLSDRLALRLESLRINAITAAAANTAASHGFFWRDLNIGGRNWVNGPGAVSIIDDVVDARKQISRYTRMRTDTIICGEEIAAAMIKNIETKRWDRVGPMAQELPKNATMQGVDFPTSGGNEAGQSERAQANIGRIAGHEVFVSNAVVLANQDDPDSALLPLLDHDVYIFKRGERLGRTVFYETPSMTSKEPDVFTRTQEWQISMCAVPIVTRPQLIFTYRNANP
jgi:hypothetical protein